MRFKKTVLSHDLPHHSAPINPGCGPASADRRRLGTHPRRHVPTVPPVRHTDAAALLRARPRSASLAAAAVLPMDLDAPSRRRSVRAAPPPSPSPTSHPTPHPRPAYPAPSSQRKARSLPPTSTPLLGSPSSCPGAHAACPCNAFNTHSFPYGPPVNCANPNVLLRSRTRSRRPPRSPPIITCSLGRCCRRRSAWSPAASAAANAALSSPRSGVAPGAFSHR